MRDVYVAQQSKNKLHNPLIGELLRRLRYELHTNILQKKLEDPFFDLDACEALTCVKIILGTDGLGS